MIFSFICELIAIETVLLTFCILRLPFAYLINVLPLHFLLIAKTTHLIPT